MPSEIGYDNLSSARTELVCRISEMPPLLDADTGTSRGCPSRKGDSSSRIDRSAIRRRFGRVLYAVGRATNVLCGLAGIVLIFVTGSPIVFLPMLGGAILGLKLQLRGKQIQMQNAHQVLAEDLCSPIVYLRPFSADPDATSFSDADVLGYLFRRFLGNGSFAWAIAIPRVVRLMFSPALTDEEQLATALKRMGPTVAVSNPAETTTPVGIPRVQLDSMRPWQDQVRALLNKSQAVLLLCGTTTRRNYSTEDGYWPTDRSRRITGGLGQEFEYVAKEALHERLVLLVPFDQMEYESFLDRVQGIFPKGLPSYSVGTPATGSLRALIGFDKDWNSKILPVTWVDTCWRIDTRFPLVDSLEHKFEWFFSKERASLRPGFVLRRIVATGVDLTLVGGIVLLTILGTPLGQRNPFPIPAIVVIWGLVLLVASCLYSSVLEASSLMATYGKKLVGLMVADCNGQRITFYCAVRRALVKYFLLPLSWVPALFGKRKALSHDGFARTEVRPGALRLREPPRWRFAILEGAIWLVGVILAIEGVFILVHSK